MLRRLSVASGVLLLSLAAAPSHALAILDMAVYSGHTYYLLEAASWADSEAAAVGLGGHLVTVNDEAENEFVYQLGVSNGIFQAGSGDLWIGLNDRALEGTFEWVSGAPLLPGDYTNWVSGEPNNFGCPPPDTDPTCVGEDAVHMPWWAPRQWNDVPEGFAMNGVVEVDSVVPEPSSLLLLSVGLAGLASRVRRRR